MSVAARGRGVKNANHQSLQSGGCICCNGCELNDEGDDERTAYLERSASAIVYESVVDVEVDVEDEEDGVEDCGNWRKTNISRVANRTSSAQPEPASRC